MAVNAHLYKYLFAIIWYVIHFYFVSNLSYFNIPSLRLFFTSFNRLFLISLFIYFFLQRNLEQSILILPSSLYNNWGLIIRDLNNLYGIVAMKSIYPSNDAVDRITDIVESTTEKYGNRNNRSNPSLLSKGKKYYVLPR